MYFFQDYSKIILQIVFKDTVRTDFSICSSEDSNEKVERPRFIKMKQQFNYNTSGTLVGDVCHRPQM